MSRKSLIIFGILITLSMPCWGAEMSLESAIGYGFNDCLSQDYDGVWRSYFPVTATLMFEFAGFAPNNSFGYYDIDTPSKKVEIFSGANSPVLTRSVEISGPFGFYLQSVQGTWYSQNFLNEDQSPHMLAFQEGPTSYLLAWEDLPFSIADKDYQDMVVRVDHAAPIPEPGTFLLMGAGLVVFSRYGRKKRSR
jgi:hypothetical protein